MSKRILIDDLVGHKTMSPDEARDWRAKLDRLLHVTDTSKCHVWSFSFPWEDGDPYAGLLGADSDSTGDKTK